MEKTGGKGSFQTAAKCQTYRDTRYYKPSFNQELIYNGRIQNGVNSYIENFHKDMIRAPFSQEIQYDLAESKKHWIQGCTY